MYFINLAVARICIAWSLYRIGWQLYGSSHNVVIEQPHKFTYACVSLGMYVIQYELFALNCFCTMSSRI
jgi:hypothetical protein